MPAAELRVENLPSRAVSFWPPWQSYMRGGFLDRQEDVVSRARRWEQEALVEIYEAHSAELYRYAARQLGDAALAEECVAETFSRFLRALHAGNGPAHHVRAYLYRIAHNWITDLWLQRTVSLDAGPQASNPAGEDPLPDVIERIRLDKVRAALAELTPEQRQVVVLRYLEGWPHEEIAQALQKSEGGVKALQRRALASLRRKLLNGEQST